MNSRSFLHFFLLFLLNDTTSGQLQPFSTYRNIGNSALRLFNLLNQNDGTLTTRKKQTSTHTSSPISTDDIFEGLNYLWYKKKEVKISPSKSEDGNIDKDSTVQLEVKTNKHKNDPNTMNSNEHMSEKLNLYLNKPGHNIVENNTEETSKIKSHFLNSSSIIGNVIDVDESGSLIISSSSRAEENHWFRIKTIAENMKSLIAEVYGKHSEEKLNIVRMIDNFLAIGEQMKLIDVIKNSFDSDLLVFLEEKWQNLTATSLEANPNLKNMLSVDTKVFLLTIARGLVKQFSHIFHNQVPVVENEHEFIIEKMRTSGFKDEEIYEVFKLLDLPVNVLLSTSNSLFVQNITSDLITFSNFTSGRSGGRDGYGYGSVKKSDPLIYLAGIAFAAFAAYVIYRLSSATPAVVQRDFKNDFLRMPHMPEVVKTIYDLLDDAEKRYGLPSENEHYSRGENLIQSVNKLWEIYKSSDLSKACVENFFCQYMKRNHKKLGWKGTNIETLTLISLSKIFEIQGIGRRIDEFQSRLHNHGGIDCYQYEKRCNRNRGLSLKEHTRNFRPGVA